MASRRLARTASTSTSNRPLNFSSRYDRQEYEKRKQDHYKFYMTHFAPKEVNSKVSLMEKIFFCCPKNELTYEEVELSFNPIGESFSRLQSEDVEAF